MLASSHTPGAADDGKRFDAVDVPRPEVSFLRGEGVRGRGWGKRSAGVGGWRMTWRIFSEVKSVVNDGKRLDALDVTLGPEAVLGRESEGGSG